MPRQCRYTSSVGVCCTREANWVVRLRQGPGAARETCALHLGEMLPEHLEYDLIALRDDEVAGVARRGSRSGEPAPLSLPAVRSEGRELVVASAPMRELAVFR